MSDQSEWRILNLATRRAVTLTNGEKPTGFLVMTRAVNGKTEYREPTDAEKKNYASDEAW